MFMCCGNRRRAFLFFDVILFNLKGPINWFASGHVKRESGIEMMTQCPPPRIHIASGKRRLRRDNVIYWFYILHQIHVEFAENSRRCEVVQICCGCFLWGMRRRRGQPMPDLWLCVRNVSTDDVGFVRCCNLCVDVGDGGKGRCVGEWRNNVYAKYAIYIFSKSMT